jgi:hypothetical protein
MSNIFFLCEEKTLDNKSSGGMNPRISFKTSWVRLKRRDRSNWKPLNRTNVALENQVSDQTEFRKWETAYSIRLAILSGGGVERSAGLAIVPLHRPEWPAL